MKGKKIKQNKKEPKNKKDSEIKMADKEKETNVSTEMTDEQFLLEIEEYTKKLKEDDSHEEDKEVQDFIEDDMDSEIDNVHQIIVDLKEEIETENIKFRVSMTLS